MSKFPAKLFAGRRYQILGLGKNGLPVALRLRAMGAEVAVWDDNEGSRQAAVEAGLGLRDPAAEMAGFDALVMSPGIPHLLPKAHPAAEAARAAGVPIVSDAELLFEAVRAAGSQAKFVGITGTNGKSTTTCLVAHVLKQAGVPVSAGGNLGPAALALPLLPDDGVYVIEMSSYMLERIQNLRFDVAVMINLTPDHLDRHGSMAGYAAAKAEIFARQTVHDLAVIGVDDDYSRAMAREARPARLVKVSEQRRSRAAADCQPDIWPENGEIRDAQGPLFAQSAAPALPGAHNGENIAITLAVVRHLGVSRQAALSAIPSFPGLPHRQSLVAQAGGVSWIDDSKATNADAAARAMACYPRFIWIAGGVSKAGGIESLVEYFPRVAFALLIGQDGALFAEILKKHHILHRVVDTMENAVNAASQLALMEGTSVVLLSPACASFDQYPNFEARGRHFAELVERRFTA